jgi:hypothetical protein
VFIFVTSFAYSWRSSCSIAVNCGGGELLCEVDKDRLEAMLFLQNRWKGNALLTRRIKSKLNDLILSI